ncbi:Catalase [Caballeronia glathei]|jgi:catalase|nr:MULTISPECIES: catalase family peroxidase [Burkholderiaceae]TCK38904.1 catalase [Paraburkholderia sp. BL8N3]CDY79194.1 Catalase [Caballeronia glathei]
MLRYAFIAATLACVVGAFAWTAGWFSQRLTPQRIVDGFEGMSGVHPGFRRNHAKGICVTGRFESNGAGAALSKASVFKAGVYPVMGRLSAPGSDPTEADERAMVRSFALSFSLPDGEQWRTAMNSAPIFAVRTPEALYEQLAASERDARTGRLNPLKMDAFLKKHPETRAFHSYIETHPPASGFDNATYYSINAFRFTDANGNARYVRWSVVPETPYEPVREDAARDADFLAHDLVSRLARWPIRWHLMISVAQPGDPVDDSTRLWPAERDRERVDAGTVVIDHAQSQIDGPCRNISFDPLILPAGIAPSSDPLLAARSSTYAVSFNRRTREEARFTAGRN